MGTATGNNNRVLPMNFTIYDGKFDLVDAMGHLPHLKPNESFQYFRQPYYNEHWEYLDLAELYFGQVNSHNLKSAHHVS